ncbi:MAG TPA: hypothetical protein VMB91_12145, partial [Solirubrobacteraceae bacterium]|nr:hypothetical protein [Solirubrobacteraceae bacterium]
MTPPAPTTRDSRWRAARARLAGLLGGDAVTGEAEPARLGDGGVDTPPPPPQTPAGWRTGPPDFVGVGFQRCGTTRWYNLITAHPEVARPVAMKELHFFDRFYSGGFGESAPAPVGDGGVDRPAPPPETPAGWRTGPPDVVGVGFQRCGTTRWYNLV